jgi:hypothetical protein
MSNPKTKEDMLKNFVSQVKCIARYWSTVDASDLEKCEGVAFSIMNIFDGTCGGYPCSVDLVLRPHEGDKQYNIEEGDDYVVDGMCINDEVQLHELLVK